MDLPRTVRKELDAISKEVFGASSKWQKYLKGVQELVTKTVKETVPGDNGAPDTERDITVPVLTPEGAKQYRTKVYGVDEIRTMLLNFKAQRDAIIAQMKAAEELKKAQQQVQELAAGKSTV